MGISRTTSRPAVSRNRSESFEGARRCRRKFLRFFPKGFSDDMYIDWERGYKAEAHQRWNETLDRKTFEELLRKKQYTEIATRAVRIESRTNLLFSFEKMALRDAVKSEAGASLFATGLYELLHGKGTSNEDSYSGLRLYRDSHGSKREC